MLVIYDERDLRSEAGASTALENLFQATDGLLLKKRSYFPPYWLLSGRCATRAGLMRCYIIAANTIEGCRSAWRSMAAIQLLTVVLLNFVQFWQTSGQGKNRAFLASCSTCFIGCNSTTLAKLIALSTI